MAVVAFSIIEKGCREIVLASTFSIVASLALFVVHAASSTINVLSSLDVQMPRMFDFGLGQSRHVLSAMALWQVLEATIAPP